MILTIFGVTLRIFSNSFLNVFQKILTGYGLIPSFVNFYTFCALSLISLFLVPFCNIQISEELVLNFLLMGILGVLGNYYIIKALSVGELSTLAPINSYKPVVALFVGVFYLGEIPANRALLAILLIILGTYFVKGMGKFARKAVFYRVLALIFSASEAIFIKKIILLTGVVESFVLWCFAGCLFSIPLVLGKNVRSVEWQPFLLLVASIALMQFSTNFVFSRMNVSYALALFQLSTILSVFLGVNVFREKGLNRKLFGASIMVVGAVILILC